MVSQSEERQGELVCTVEATPDNVDAGAVMMLRAEVSSSPQSDLRGHQLAIKDQSGADVGVLELTDFDGEARSSGTLKINAPFQTGEYVWSLFCPAHSTQDISYPEISADVSFVVRPHAIRVLAWDVPTAVVGGEAFKMKIGIKCSSECQLANEKLGIKDFQVLNHEGVEVATGEISGEVWPETTGLFFNEIELDAPSAEGLYNWTVTCSGANGSVAHAEGTATFGLRVVGQPEHLISVEAIDRATQAPLGGARIVLHPYATVSDERGIAQIRVAKGAYQLFVARTAYLTFGQPVEVAADMTIRAELDLEPIPERN
jgi:hypothetical protein